jgi:hypothetical protein
MFGCQDRGRTYDHRINSPGLYQLSYMAFEVAAQGDSNSHATPNVRWIMPIRSCPANKAYSRGAEREAIVSQPVCLVSEAYAACSAVLKCVTIGIQVAFLVARLIPADVDCGSIFRLDLAVAQQPLIGDAFIAL